MNRLPQEQQGQEQVYENEPKQQQAPKETIKIKTRVECAPEPVSDNQQQDQGNHKENSGVLLLLFLLSGVVLLGSLIWYVVDPSGDRSRTTTGTTIHYAIANNVRVEQ